MPAEQADGFADNWIYLRTELQWLDRLLLAAVAKQRKETKDIDRIAQSKADRVTSHWWKGMILPEGKAAYDEYRPPTASSNPKPSYQRQMETQIRATQQRGVVLALPTLCERLQLNPFEKNVVLMSLAPEVNRRYARLYRYLQGEDSGIHTDLPTLDLTLRLLCKNDSEWRTCRNHLINTSPLTQYQLLEFLPAIEDTLLNCSLRLIPSLVNYLLTEQPTPQTLETLLTPIAVAPPASPPPPLSAPSADSSAAPFPPFVSPASAVSFLHPVESWQSQLPPAAWSDLIVSDAILEALQTLAQRLQGSERAAEHWGITTTDPGLMALWVGATGTGKTLAARALATALETSCVQIDLEFIEPDDYGAVLADVSVTCPKVLLLQSAQFWLKRSSPLSAVKLQQFWQQRRCLHTITLFSLPQVAAVQTRWQCQMHQVLQFAMPDVAARLQLWRRAFPSSVLLDTEINWMALAKQLPINAREIQSIVHESISYAAIEDHSGDHPMIMSNHILKALLNRGKKVDI